MNIRVEPMALVFLAGMLLCDGDLLCLATVIAACVHEAGHLLAARCLNIPLRSMKLGILGAGLEPARLLSYGEEWLLCAAGPLFSLLLSALSAIGWQSGNFWQLLSCVSLLLGLLNLLPIRSFDGGRMLHAALSAMVGERFAESVLFGCSFFSLLLLWFVSVYCLLRVGNGVSLFCFSMSLMTRFLKNLDVGSGEKI